MKQLWLEYEEGKSDTARFVPQMHILERDHQAMIYEARTQQKDFEVSAESYPKRSIIGRLNRGQRFESEVTRRLSPSSS